jgi:HEPN domain-containing protein
MRKATAEWLKSAELDIDIDYLTPVAAFHSQQCVEKCLKAVLEEYSRKVPEDHSTLRLYGLIKDLISIDVDLAVLTDLDDLYMESRYPGELGLLPYGKPTVADAQEFFRTAQAIYARVNREFAVGGDDQPL